MSEISVEYENSVCKNAKVYGFLESIKRAKYPLAVETDPLSSEVTPGIKKLAMAAIGSGEDTFLNGFIVQFDLTLTKQAWSEMERYHFMDFVSSQSTMHCISKMDILHQCAKWTDSYAINALEVAVQKYLDAKQNYADGKLPFDSLEEYFYDMIYSIPSGFKLTAGMTTNYRQLKTIYKQRRTHRLKPDWGEFCDWCEHLPFSEFITGKLMAENNLEHVGYSEEQCGREK